MLNYRHALHAGNYADVLKHLVLTITIECFKKLSSPILYVDTHAGSGLYRLDSDKNKYINSIKALDFSVLPSSITPYQQCVESYLRDNRYPGSPLISAKLLREQDQLQLFELHPAEYNLLKELFVNDPRVVTSHSDGYQVMQTSNIGENKQVIVLIDPPFETEDDFTKIIQFLQQEPQQITEQHYLIWYPVTRRYLVDTLIEQIIETELSDIWRFELGISKDTNNNKMTASGVIVIKPPSLLNRHMAELLPIIKQQLVPSGYYLIEKLPTPLVSDQF